MARNFDIKGQCNKGPAECSVFSLQKADFLAEKNRERKTATLKVKFSDFRSFGGAAEIEKNRALNGH